MANYTPAAATTHKTLTAGAPDTVTFPADYLRVEVFNRGTTDAIYFTVDGVTAPAIAADGTDVVMPGDSLVVDATAAGTANSTTIRLISSGAMAYSIRCTS